MMRRRPARRRHHPVAVQGSSAFLACSAGLVLSLISSLLPAPASAQGARLLAPRAGAAAKAGGLDAVLAVGSDGIARLEAGGAATRIPLPEGTITHSLAATGSGWILAGEREVQSRRELVLLRLEDDGRQVTPLTLPAAEQRLAQEPLPLTSGRDLEGLAWLEGANPRQLAVKVARWQGDGFGESLTVAPPGPGSQLALTGAVLEDGRWLLAWSAFDGEDDEILWSLGSKDGASWSEPRRLTADNRVPDVVPALTATAGGALLAWSRYDGNDYQLTLARFSAQKAAEANPWQEVGPAGPAGSMFPEFQRLGDRNLLVYRVATPRSWAVAEVGDGGAVVRRSRLDLRRPVRPVVTHEKAGLALRWPGEAEGRVLTWEEP